MPTKFFGKPPFPPLAVKDTDQALTMEDITALMGERDSLSFCLRSESGPKKRGGYFFHIKQNGENFSIHDFSGSLVAPLSGDMLIRFINHCTGTKFDDEMLILCQSVVNHRQDEEGAEKKPKKSKKII